jgi:hypothetical protein
MVWWEVREIGGLELGRAAWLKIYGDPLVLKAASRAAGFPIWPAITDIPRKMTTARLMEQPSHSGWLCKETGALKVFVSRMSRLKVCTKAPAAKLHYSLIDSFILTRFVHPHLLSAAFP